MSLATLLSQHNEVVAVDVVPEKVEKLNGRISPIQDEFIEKYLAGEDADGKPVKLNLTATLDRGRIQGRGLRDNRRPHQL